MTVAIPAPAAASTTIPAPTKFSVVILPAVPTADPSSLTDNALMVTVAIPAATAASATTLPPMKLIVEMLFAEPTILLSSRIVIPSIAPAGAEVTHCGSAPAPFD